ncbi:hypothetical protein CRE_12317 [Caenorhabditis remanei]|uniref:Uncharacterized protein n=1 Tax=Caenorhabditis remanei TaxID=31234 RepID=E3NH23_CAERE|nr:hypothetical protein CRE_12317 [Caenorhabditis remanei]
MADDEKKKKEPERRSIRIDEYFIKAAKSDSVEREIAEKKKKEEEEGENNQQKEVALQDLKCPKRKLVFETDDTDDIAKKKQAVRNRKSEGAMKKLEKGQRILDCGQKLIGSTTCKDCEMVYCVDDAADVKAHEKFHREWKFRFEIPKTFVMQMLKFYNRDMNDYKVYYLHTSGEEAFKKLMSKHIGVINTYLGYTGTDDVWSTDKRIFMILLLREERMMIGGILIIEKVTKAYTNVTRKSFLLIGTL